ncbi:MAG: helix-turn-helix transcriptional regulator [Aureliella sp.]
MQSTTLPDRITDGHMQSLLDVEDVAARLKCSSRSVRRLADAGKMPAPVRLGSMLRWPIAVIDEWIGEGCPPVSRRRR